MRESSATVRIIQSMMRCAKIWWLNATVIICLINSTTGHKPSSQPNIIIVGAGPSGIAAASKLYEHGFENVTILEAENRIGGRVYTTWFDESWIDLGAQWVHGQTNNIAYELASPLGLLEVPQGHDPHFSLVYTSEGYQIPTSISNALIQLYLDLDERSGEEPKGNDGSVGDYFTRMITVEATHIPGANETLVKQFIKLFEAMQNVEDASDNWDMTSVTGFTEYWACPGSFVVNWKDRGYKTILDILMRKYPNPENELPVMNNTVLETEVVNIDYNSTEGKVLVESSDGKKYEADHVISTPSLGVLKEQYGTLFTPQLPEAKVKTIKGLAMGTVAKIVLFFESAWWPQNSPGFTFMWNKRDRQEYENDPHKKWLLDVAGFFRVLHRPHLLLCWMVGPGSRYMETLPEDRVLNQTLELLNKFVGNSYNIPRPTSILRSQWYTNKHFRGTYSFRSTETERADVWAAELAAPLSINGIPIVLFAGEATSPHYYSTVHGAIETGFREADRLIDLYKNT